MSAKSPPRRDDVQLDLGIVLEPSTADDGSHVEQLWHQGRLHDAIDAADRVLAGHTDVDCRAAGIAAAAAAADGELRDAATRWHDIADALGDGRSAWALGRAALASALAGEMDVARADLDDARSALPVPAPRGLRMLLDGIEATLAAQRDEPARAARRLSGLAAATVPADPLAVERWDELAISAAVAGGDEHAARAMLAASEQRPQTPRQLLLSAWLDLRAGRASDARKELRAAAETQVLRRNGFLAAAITVGIARRAGDTQALAAAWHRAAPLVSGTDVEPLLLDAWGELACGAAQVSPIDGDTLAEKMAAAVTRAGSPVWCVAIEQWRRLERAVITGQNAEACAATDRLATVAADGPAWAENLAVAARTWVAVTAGNIDPAAVSAAAHRLVAAGRPWEASSLCAVASERATEPAVARELLARRRELTAEPARGGAAGQGLSEREREVGALVLEGYTQKQIGTKLYLSPRTVEQHVARLRQKLGAANRAELIAELRARLVT